MTVRSIFFVAPVLDNSCFFVLICFHHSGYSGKTFLYLLKTVLYKTVYLDFLSMLVSLEVVVQRCSVKKMFLKILQNSQENTCARAFFS